MLWNNLWTRNLYIDILKKSIEQFSELQNSWRIWRDALNTANMENTTLMNKRYPELSTPVTLESIFALRKDGQKGDEVWFDGYELSV